MADAICKRKMQFCAGPQTATFYACETHRRKLEEGDVSCFLRLPREPVQHVGADEAEGETCDFCHES